MTTRRLILLLAYLAVGVAILYFSVQYSPDALKAVVGVTIGGFVSAGVLLFGRPVKRFMDNLNVETGVCRILIVGLGRSGKTSLIKQILTKSEPGQERSTMHYDIWPGDVSMDLSGTRRCKVLVADYKGQQISQVLFDIPEDFVGPSGDRRINVLIFVVDLFPEVEAKRASDAPRILDDEEALPQHCKNAPAKMRRRVRDHEEYLTKYFIEAVFARSYSKENLLGVRLFVNKCDLLRKVASRGCLPEFKEEAMQEFVEASFARIIAKVRAACAVNQVDFTCLYGSAKSGENVQAMIGKLIGAYEHRRNA